MFENGTVQTVGHTMTEILTPVKIFWPQGLRCQSVERPDDQNRVNLLRQVRKILRERSRNPNREVWESPSVYGGEDVKDLSSRLGARGNGSIITLDRYLRSASSAGNFCQVRDLSCSTSCSFCQKNFFFLTKVHKHFDQRYWRCYFGTTGER